MGVSVRQKAKGGPWWIFVRYKGERCSQKIGTREDASAVAIAVKSEIARGRFNLASMRAGNDAPPAEEEKTTLAQYFERFDREYLQAGVRESTATAYRGAFRKYILPVLGEVPLDELSRTQVKALVSSLVTRTYARRVAPAGARPAAKVRELVTRSLSRSTIRIIAACLSSCLNHAKEDGLISENPATRLTKLYRQAKVVHAEVEPLTAHEVPRFLQAVLELAPEHYALFLTLLHTGVRSGEAAGLEWGDVDFAGKFIVIRRTRTPSGRVENTKTDRVRRVDMSDALLVTLEMHRRRLQEVSMKAGRPLPDPVFPNREGNPIDMHNLKNRVFHRCLEQAGLRRIRLHDLRHSYASMLIQAGVSLAYVQQQLGHASIKLTVDTYTHLVPGANRQAVNILPTAEPRERVTRRSRSGAGS